MRGSRQAYFEARKKRLKLKELQNTQGTEERADYLSSPKGLFVETMKGVGRKLDTPFRKVREESDNKRLRRGRR